MSENKFFITIINADTNKEMSIAVNNLNDLKNKTLTGESEWYRFLNKAIEQIGEK